MAVAHQGQTKPANPDKESHAMNDSPHRAFHSPRDFIGSCAATQWPKPHEPNPEPDVPVVPPHQPDEAPAA